MTFRPKKLEVTDGTDTLDIDSDGNAAVEVREGLNVTKVQGGGGYAKYALTVVREIAGTPWSYLGENVSIPANGTLTTVVTGPVTSGFTGYLMQVMVSVYIPAGAFPIKCRVYVNGIVVHSFWVGSVVTTTAKTVETVEWNCNFSDLFSAAGGQSFQVKCSMETGGSVAGWASALVIWREIHT